MEEEWRVKRYYEKRILVKIDDILENTWPDSVLCLTGGEMSLLRNLLDYANRRSTWVSEYRENDYLGPDEAEWDAIEPFVGGLEEKLMGCVELTQLLEDIKAAAQCACDRLTALPPEAWPAGGTLDGQRDYDDYQSSVEYEVGDPPAPFETWDDWEDYKCKAAQRLVDDITDLGERLEVVYTGGAAIVFAVFQTLVLGTAVAPPVALVISIITILAVAGTALAMIAFQNWCQNNKEDLVCAIHWAETVAVARAGILSVIADNWDLVLGRAFGEHLFSYDVLSKCFDGGLDVDGYLADYCLNCGLPELPLDIEWHFPPETGWILGEGCYYDGNGHLTIPEGLVGRDCWSPPYLAPPDGNYTLEAWIEGWGYDTNLGWVIQRSTNLADWSNWKSRNEDTAVPDMCYPPIYYTTAMTWNPGFPYIRFVAHNRTSDRPTRVCSLRFKLTP